MQIIENPDSSQWPQLLARPTQSVQDIEFTVHEIFAEIRQKGDIAVSKYTELFDGAVLDNNKVNSSEIESAKKAITKELVAAIALAKNNIEKFHKAQKTETVRVETSPGVQCWIEKRPIERVGLYIPGGSAPLFSTILMLAIPAVLAGCKEIVLCTPPNKDGSVHPAILYTADLCGVTQIYKVGGIQAIGALAFGTDAIPKVDKIFGPGNQYVTVAKQLATKFQVAIDMPAGPSELMIFADDTAVPSFLASDLLSQAEHGADSQVILVSTSKRIAEKTLKEIKVQSKVLPRNTIVNQSIINSKIVVVETNEEALRMINMYSPEHLIIISENEDYFVRNIANAGSVFLGNFTPESAGDYASGTNHTLPTNGYAKQYSGVNLDSFMKSMTFQKISEEGLNNIGNAIECMAEAEGLQAHKNAVTLRLDYLKA
ncbi:MAG: histidinol dehydrogenase [Aureisphaera sp.]